jgi:hypothetical protein
MLQNGKIGAKLDIIQIRPYISNVSDIPEAVKEP